MHKKFMLLTLLTTINASQAETPTENFRDLIKAQTKAEIETGKRLSNLADVLTENNQKIAAALMQKPQSRNPRSLVAFVAGAAVGTGCTLWVAHKDVPALRDATYEYLQALKQASTKFFGSLRQPAKDALKDIIDNHEHSVPASKPSVQKEDAPAKPAEDTNTAKPSDTTEVLAGNSAKAQTDKTDEPSA